MLFTGSFKDINGVKYNVEINATNEVGESVELTFSSTPCVISGSSDGLFSPIKSRSCSLEFVTTDYYKELYDPISRGTTVKIMRVTGPNESVNYTTIFKGYLLPCSYNQDYSFIDTVTLEAVDGISTAKDYKWSSDGEYHNLLGIIWDILSGCNYTGTLYIPKTYTKINGSTINTDILTKLKVSANNFIDDDDEHTPWTQYEVLEEILKFLGWSLVPDGNDIYLVDYKAINNGSTTFAKFNLYSGGSTSSTETFNLNNTISVENGDFASGSSSISIDDIYNSIKITDNLYEIDELCPDIFDDGAHISITDEQPTLGPNGSQWTKTTTKNFLWWETDRDTVITGYDFQTFCRLNPNTGWTHFWYKHSDQSPLGDSVNNPTNYTDSASNSLYTKQVNGVLNTHSCILQHYAHVKEQGENNIPATIDWTEYLTFFVCDDTTVARSIYDLDTLEKPVLQYKSGESIQWKPASGTSWLTIKGDLWYQYNGAKYGDKGKSTLNIVNTEDLFYTTAPVDKAVSIDGSTLYGMALRKKSNSDYGKGFSLWKMKLQIGNKYWDGSAWTSTESTFYIKYNNNPDGENDETVQAFAWMNAVNTNTYKDKVGVDGYCIPIAYNDSNAPTDGILTLTVYTPSLLPTEIVDLYKQYFPNWYNQVNFNTLTLPVIYCKGFEFDYVYTDSNVWYNNHKDESKKDKLYVGYINEDFKEDFDGLEFKINTAIKDKPISRSYVTITGIPNRSGYLQSLKHRNSTDEKVQEYNVIDQYLDHYSERKVIYETNLKGYFSPLQRFTIPHKSDYKSIEGEYVIDTQSFDVAANNNRIKLIEY